MLARNGIAIGLLFGATLSSPSFGQSAAASTQSDRLSAASLTQGLDDVIEKYHLGRVWLHVEQDGAVVANLGIRGANADEPEPVGSLSKSITAIAIALLIQNRKLTIDTTVGDVLSNTYAQHNRPLDANLKNVTIERLLTHTAGLRPNKITDPFNGLATEDVLGKLSADATTFDFLSVSDGDHSNGQNTYVYSNMSYLMLGLVVEAVSHENYRDFCVAHIFRPLHIANASLLTGQYRAVSAYSGWVLSQRDIAKIWLNVFDRRHPTLLKLATLDKTLFAPLGQAIGSNKNSRFTLGLTIRRSVDGTSYRLFQNGVQGTRFSGADHGSFYSYMEDTVPGSIWIFATSPVPPQANWRNIDNDVRDLVANALRTNHPFVVRIPSISRFYPIHKAVLFALPFALTFTLKVPAYAGGQ